MYIQVVNTEIAGNTVVCACSPQDGRDGIDITHDPFPTQTLCVCALCPKIGKLKILMGGRITIMIFPTIAVGQMMMIMDWPNDALGRKSLCFDMFGEQKVSPNDFCLTRMLRVCGDADHHHHHHHHMH